MVNAEPGVEVPLTQDQVIEAQKKLTEAEREIDEYADKVEKAADEIYKTLKEIETTLNVEGLFKGMSYLPQRPDRNDLRKGKENLEFLREAIKRVGPGGKLTL